MAPDDVNLYLSCNKNPYQLDKSLAAERKRKTQEDMNRTLKHPQVQEMEHAWDAHEL